jgi:serine/threonine protein kinase
VLQEKEQLVLPELAVGLGLPDSPFTVEKLLSGGMGVCAKVLHNASGKPFAIKLINDYGLRNDDNFARFLQEIRVWATAASCEAVLPILAVLRINEVPCVCSAWMAGGDLRQYLSRNDHPFFFQTIDRVLAGLDWVNEKHRIIHRDLKPPNILLDESGNAFIADWGIARLLSSAEPTKASNQPHGHLPSTQTGQFIGTVAYSSPEQIVGSRNLDHRADIYSLGCILFEWEAGHPPFLGRTIEEIAFQHLERPAPHLGRTRFGVERIIRRCLEKDPSDRYPTYAELRTDLHAVARAASANYIHFTPKIRAAMPLVGAEEIKTKGIRGSIQGAKEYSVAEFDNILPYLQEAEILSTLGDWSKARDILDRLYVPELITQLPDDVYHQLVAVNLGNALTKMGLSSEAIEVLGTISTAKERPAAYFVNLTLALMHAGRYQDAVAIAKEGLSSYPKDPDILGNLSIALLTLGKPLDAVAAAEQRLKYGRDVHSLEELAGVRLALGEETANSDWPQAVTEFGVAVALLLEARQLNPRYLTVRLNLAKAWFHLEDFVAASREAAESFALAANPSMREFAAIIQAECLDRVGSHKECVSFCDSWLKSCPDSVGLQRVRAETIVDAYCIGKEKDGIHIVERTCLEFFTKMASESGAHRASDLRYLARLREWMGDVKDAFRLLDEAEQVQPNHWEVPFNRASFYWRTQDLRSALFHAQRACTLGLWVPQAWRLIAHIHDALQNHQEAEDSRARGEQVSRKKRELAGRVLMRGQGAG